MATIFEDPRLPPAGRATPADYHQSRYKETPLAPPHDTSDPATQTEALALSNAVPLIPALAQGPWRQIEAYVHNLAHAQQSELFVVTGAGFTTPTLAEIGPRQVLVPNLVWKAIADPKTGLGGAWICQNAQPTSCAVTTIAELRATVAIDPFPALSEAAKSTALALPLPVAPETREGLQDQRKTSVNNAPTGPNR